MPGLMESFAPFGSITSCKESLKMKVLMQRRLSTLITRYINECQKGLAYQCDECACKNSYGRYECKCKGRKLYIVDQDTCMGEIGVKFCFMYVACFNEYFLQFIPSYQTKQRC